MSSDIEYMRRALALAERGRGTASPNPMVGCVIVQNQEVVGEGYHAQAGGPHAEVAAYAAAGERPVAGATVYLTLEPCTHWGRTPPCAPLLIEKKPSRVVIAMEDPNPRVSGSGIAALREAGIPVEVGLCAYEARRLNEWYIKHMETGRPFVIAKCAMTLDGKIATRTGHSRWVTGEESRRRVHELRNTVDAILVGSRTVMLDDPSLTTRLNGREGRDPIRVLLDAGEYLDSGRRVFSVKSNAPTWVAVCQDRDYPFASGVIRVPPGPGGVDMAALMDELGKRNITSLMIEGGGTTLGTAFEAGIVDKVLFFIAPKIVGGKDAVTPVEGMGFASMDEAILLEDVATTHCGEDLLVEAYVKNRP